MLQINYCVSVLIFYEIVIFVFMIFNNIKIPVFWWSSKKFENKKFENFGDLVGPYLVEKISGKNVRFIQPKKRKFTDLFTKVYFTAGSILAHIDTRSIVWGSGIIETPTKVPKATFLAVRGPLTRAELLKQGYNVPEVYGDPAILLPKFYTPELTKKYKIGIIPHYVDYDKVLNWYKDDITIKVINLLNNSVEAVVNEIYSCETIISSSLHGIIVAHTYKTPAVWVKFSDNLFGDDTKFYDYFNSVKIPEINPVFINEKKETQQLLVLATRNGLLANSKIIERLQNGLMKVCPF